MTEIDRTLPGRAQEMSLREDDVDVLAQLKIAREASGRSLDFWADFTEGLNKEALEIIVSRASMISEKGN